MSLITYILLIVIILCMLAIWFLSTYNRFQESIIRMNEAESNIDATLRKRFDLLNKAATIVKTNIEIDKNIFEIIDNIRSKKLSNFELDRQLYDAINEFHQYKEEYKELKKNDEFNRIDLSLQESEAEIVAFRKYYNDIITDYNRLARAFPSIIIAKINKYNIRLYFDGKNMEDNDIKDM